MGYERCHLCHHTIYIYIHPHVKDIDDLEKLTGKVMTREKVDSRLRDCQFFTIK